MTFKEPAIMLALACCSWTASASITFIDAQDICIAGRGFAASELGSPYDRLPAKAEGVVRDAVWTLSRMSAGLHIDFETNSTSISTNITYRYEDTTMWHFASTGVAGIDVYRWSDADNAFRWVGTTVKNDYPSSMNTLVSGLPPATAGTSASLYRMHLPTYNAPVALAIGIDSDATITPACDDTSAPVVHYGTSIAQGAVPARPGHAYTNDVAMRTGRTVLNFGFSGNGIMETSVAEFLVQIKPAPAVLVIDCLPNMTPEQVTANTVPLVTYIRKTLPETPIFLVEGTTYGASWLGGTVGQAQADKRAALTAQYNKLVSDGVTGLTYVNGTQFFDDPLINPTVGGTHPTDLGSASMAAAWTRLLGKALGAPVPLRRPPQAATAAAAAATSQRVTAPSSDEERLAARKALRDAFALERRVMAGKRASPSEAASSPVPGASQTAQPLPAGASVSWTPLTSLTVLGQAFPGKAPNPFNRLPSAASGVVRDMVWELSEMSTGVRVAFESNSTAIALNYTTAIAPEPLWHMPASGTAGADLYVLDDWTADGSAGTGVYRWVGTVEDLPTAAGARSVSTLTDQLPARAAPRQFLLHLPLRNWPMADATIGVLEGSSITPSSGPYPDTDHAIAWYGTSIEQGGVASRPGDTYTNIISRATGKEVFNFGFAGNGKDELNVTEFLVQAPHIAVFIIDCLPNLNAEEVSQRTGPVVNAVRAALGDAVPVVLAEGTTYGDAWLGAGVSQAQAEKRAALTQVYKDLVAAGVPNLHYVSGDQLFAPVWGSLNTSTPTVGGTHPSSLGHREVATAWIPILTKLLQ